MGPWYGTLCYHPVGRGPAMVWCLLMAPRQASSSPLNQLPIQQLSSLNTISHSFPPQHPHLSHHQHRQIRSSVCSFTQAPPPSQLPCHGNQIQAQSPARALLPATEMPTEFQLTKTFYRNPLSQGWRRGFYPKIQIYKKTPSWR